MRDAHVTPIQTLGNYLLLALVRTIHLTYTYDCSGNELY